MKNLKIKNGLNNNFNSTHPTPLYQCAVNEALTSLFCLLVFLFLYACSSSDPSPIPPNTTTHKVTFNPNTPSASSATVSNLPAEQNVTEGNLATKPTAPPTLDGYTFGGWYTEARTTNAFQFSTKITKATTLYAKWTPRQTFTITYHANKPTDAPTEATVTGVPQNPVSISEGQTATAPTSPTLTGYDFVAWYTEATATNQFDFSQVLTANIDLYAKWTIQVFTVTYDVNKPSSATAEVTGMLNPIMINYNLTTTAPRPAPALEGYTFEGWYTEQATTTEFAFTTPITANIDLYAKWTTIQTFTVTYHGNKPQDVTANVTGVRENPVSISEGQTVAAPTPPTLAGYNFVGWYTEATATNQFDFSQGITANIDLYAKWTQDPVVSFNMQGGSPIEPQTLTGTSKRATRPDNPAREDYTFDNWYTQATGGALFDFSQTITAQSTTVYARWNRITRTVTYRGNKPDTVPSGVSVSNLPDPVNVNSGETTTAPIPAPELEDYVFQGWFAGTTESTAFAFETTAIKENKVLYAKWTRKEITITFYGNKPSTAPTDASITGLSTDPTIVTVNSGETTTAITPPPELTGYTLEGWFIGTISGGMLALQDTAFDFTTTTIRGENINLYAKWLQKFTVTYHGNKPQDVTANVTGVTENPVSIPEGQTAAVPTPPTLTGYNFVAWYTEATATNQFDFSQGITTSIDLYAKWSQDPVVTFDTQGGSPIDPQRLTGTLKRATRPDDPAREDYTFDNWYTTADTGTTLFNFDQDITAQSTIVYARWNRIMRTITYHGNEPDNLPSGVSVTSLPDPATINVSSGDTATAPTPKPGLQDYVFQGWFAGTITGTLLRLENTAFAFETTAIKENKNLYAKWTRKEITITFYGNKPDTAPTDVSITGLTTDPTIVTVNSGETTTAITPPPELTGYTLDGWFIGTISEGTLALQDIAFDFTTTIRGENINLYAKWSQNPIVTFDTQGGSNIDSQTITGSVTMAARPDVAPTREGYVFDNWYTMATGGELFDFSATTPITASITIYAQWIQQFTVTYHANKPSDAPQDATVTGVSTTPVPVNSGDRITTPNDPTLTGYNFVGWYTEEATTNQFNFSQVITTNIDLYAKWSQNPIVTFDTQGGSNIDSQTITGSVTMAVRPDVAPTREGYVFDNWYTMATGGDVFDFSATTPITASITIYAQWIQQFTVTYHANKPSDAPEGATVTGVSTTPIPVNSGDRISAPNDPTLTGYNFVGWYTEEAATNQFNFSQVITTNIDLYAKWSQNPIVTFDTQGGSNIDSQTITGSVTMAVRPDVAPTREGYVFDNWYTMATGGDVFDFSATTPITASITIYAQWIQQFTITYHDNKPSDAPEDATVTGVSTTPVPVNSGDRISTPNDPTLANYNFVGWYTEEATTNQFNFSQVITTNIDLYAKWSQNPIVTFDTQGGSNIDSQTITGSVNMAARPDVAPTREGYVFDNWYTMATGGDVFDFSATTPITASITIYAQWIQQFTITYHDNKPSGATDTNVAGMPDSVKINYNLATAEPSSGPTLDRYTFEGWYTDQATTKIFVFSTRITANIDLYAKWVFRPSTKAELVAEINRAITPTTPSPNLNYIDTSLIKDMSSLFKDKSNFNGDISGWNVSLVEDMNQMFRRARGFNQNISSWNVAKVADMSYMFDGASVFNGNISSWNVAMVTNMSFMFAGARAFNQDLSSWNVAMVTNMSRMFNGASVFNQNISSWNVSEVTNMSYMFNFATVFNQNISSWNVSKVTNMSSMFANTSVFNQNISSWNVAKVTNMSSMFSGASAFNQDLSSWNVSLVENMSSMFSGASVFNGNISSWNVSLVENMSSMFYLASVFNQNISSWNVSLVEKMEGMFYLASVFNGNISEWNVSKVTNMSYMFFDAIAFNQNISSWNVSLVKNMSNMFKGASVFNQNISSWNVSEVTNMNAMFSNATAFNQNISSWNVSEVTNMNAMFSNATAFNQNISSWNVSKVTNMSYMFAFTSVFNGDISNWRPTALTNMSYMFISASAFTQNINSWNIASSVDKTNAFTDSGLASLPSWATP